MRIFHEEKNSAMAASSCSAVLAVDMTAIQVVSLILEGEGHERNREKLTLKSSSTASESNGRLGTEDATKLAALNSLIFALAAHANHAQSPSILYFSHT